MTLLGLAGHVPNAPVAASRSSNLSRVTKLFNATIIGEEVSISLPYTYDDVSNAISTSEETEIELEVLLYMLRGRCEGRKA